MQETPLPAVNTGPVCWGAMGRGRLVRWEGTCHGLGDGGGLCAEEVCVLGGRVRAMVRRKLVR